MNFLAWTRLASTAVVLTVAASVVAAQSTMVRLDTSLGLVDIRLYDAQAPATVANFLGYAQDGTYDNSFIHRSVPGFVVQGGGYRLHEGGGYSKVPAGPPVANEFSRNRSNTRGTVAMAKLAGNPNSATTEWFVNLADNSANLDFQNGGFTVFGRVTAPGMAVFDAMARLQRVNAGAPFSDLPVVGLPSSGPLLGEHLVMVKTAKVLHAATPADRIFNYLEAAYPHYLSPADGESTTGHGYYYRYYPGTQSYVGEANGVIYYLVPAINDNINSLGSVAEWLGLAGEAGY